MQTTVITEKNIQRLQDISARAGSLTEDDHAWTLALLQRLREEMESIIRDRVERAKPHVRCAPLPKEKLLKEVTARDVLPGYSADDVAIDTEMW